MAELARIVELTRPGPGVAVVTFASGESVEIEWAAHASAGSVFAQLGDPGYADQWQIADWGYALRWPDGMDWSAGAVLKHGKRIVPNTDQK